LHILYDHQMFSIQKFGGISRIFIELMRELSAELECSIHWHRGLHIDEYDISDYSKRLKRYWAFQKVPFLLHKRINEKINKLSFKWFVRLFGRQYDIYHPTYYDPSLLEIAKAKKNVITIHDMIPEKYLFSLSKFQKLIEDRKYLVERADLIFVNSKNTQNDLEEILKVDSKKVLITYWATRMKEQKTVELPDICLNKPYFLYAGTRSKYKNFEVLMKAFAIDHWLKSNFQVVCFGGTSGFIKPELKFLEDHSLMDNFIYLNGNDDLLKTLYINTQALISTSRYEGFGLTLLEAMACGCPVICCQTSSIPEVVSDAALFFDPDSPLELAQYMRKVVEDEEKKAEMIQKGLNRANLFSWKKTAKQTLNGYKTII